MAAVKTKSGGRKHNYSALYITWSFGIILEIHSANAYAKGRGQWSILLLIKFVKPRLLFSLLCVFHAHCTSYKMIQGSTS